VKGSVVFLRFSRGRNQSLNVLYLWTEGVNPLCIFDVCSGRFCSKHMLNPIRTLTKNLFICIRSYNLYWFCSSPVLKIIFGFYILCSIKVTYTKLVLTLYWKSCIYEFVLTTYYMNLWIYSVSSPNQKWQIKG
jgi:hypothetical protein